MKKLFSKEMAIGFSVLVALAILIFGIDYLKGARLFGGSNYYYVRFDNVEGLAEAASVNLNGLKVGQVGSLKYDYDHPGYVVVELDLDKELRLPQGTTATLYTDLLGTASIRLDLGKADSYCKIGDFIDGTVDAGMLQAVTDQLLPGVGGITEKADTLLGNLNALATDPNIAASLENIAAITRDLNNITAQVNLLVASLSPVVANVRSITSNVDSITGDLNVLTSNLRELPVDSLVAEMEGTLSNLRTLSAQLADPDSSLGQLIGSRELYDNLNATITSLDELFIDIRRNPKRYVTIKVF